MNEKNKERILLIFDLNNILWKGLSVLPNLTYDGRFTSGIYGVIQQMAAYTERYDPERFVICNDSPPYKRKEIFPSFKGHDTEPDYNYKTLLEQLNESRPYCMDIFDRLGIQVLEERGYEADDIIAQIVLDMNDKYDKIVICSNDDDLYQLLQFENVFLDKGRKGIYTGRDFRAEYDTTPEDWVKVLSLAGNHNSVPPIKKGIGRKTAIKILNNPLKLKEIEKQYPEEIELRKKLATLPYASLNIKIQEKTNTSILGNFVSYIRRHFGITEQDNLVRFYERCLK